MMRLQDQPITKDLIAQHGLTDEEYKKIVESFERGTYHGAESH